MPSIVCYKNGVVVAVGAETDVEVNSTLAEMDGVIRVEWWVVKCSAETIPHDLRF